MTRIKSGCALSVKRIRRKSAKYKRKLRKPHLTMSALAKERATAKIMAKARGELASIAVSKDTLHESAQLLKGNETQELAPAATVDAVPSWLHPEAVELLSDRKLERQGQRPRPIL